MIIRRHVFEIAVRWLPLPVLLQLLRRTARWLPHWAKIEPQNCLEDSLLDITRAARAGKTAALAIGVKKEDGSLMAHAWAEDPDEAAGDKDGFHKIGTL